MVGATVVATYDPVWAQLKGAQVKVFRGRVVLHFWPKNSEILKGFLRDVSKREDKEAIACSLQPSNSAPSLCRNHTWQRRCFHF